MRSTREEKEMIKAIHEKRLFDQIMPAVRAAVKAGGGADAVLKKSETLAALALIEGTQSEKDEVRLKAATEILNRTIGRPVERSINIYGDLTRMNEKDVDSQIMLLLENTGASKLLKDAGVTAPKSKRSKQKRKPRQTTEQTIDAEYTVRQEGSAGEQAVEADARTEAGTPSES